MISTFSSNQQKAEASIIKLSIFIVVVGLTSWIVSLFYLNIPDLILIYEHNPLVLSITVIYSVRIAVTAGLATIMFHNFLKMEHKSFTGIPFLAGWFFLLSALGKGIDMFRSVYYYSSNFSEDTLIRTLQGRIFLLVLTYFPLIFLCLIPALSVILSSKVNEDGNEKYNSKTQKYIAGGVGGIYIVIFGVLAFTPSTTTAVSLLVTILTLTSNIFVIWLFWFINKNEKLPQINSRLLALTFVLYQIFSVIPTVIRVLGLLGVEWSVMLEDALFMATYIFMLRGFTTPASYASKDQ